MTSRSAVKGSTNCATLAVACEQSLFFFRFSMGSACARALSGEAARREKRVRRASPVSRLQSRAWSFACLGRFARRTKKRDCS